MLWDYSSKDITRPQGKDLITVEEEFRARKGCSIPRFSNSTANPESYGVRRGLIYIFPGKVNFR